jgi:hypothetical protein
MEMVIEAGKAKISAPSPAPSQREPLLLLEGSKKGAGNSQHPRGVKLRLSLCHKPFIF